LTLREARPAQDFSKNLVLGSAKIYYGAGQKDNFQKLEQPSLKRFRGLVWVIEKIKKSAILAILQHNMWSPCLSKSEV